MYTIIDFFGRLYLGPYGLLRPEIFTRASIDQQGTPQLGQGSPKKNLIVKIKNLA